MTRQISASILLVSVLVAVSIVVANDEPERAKPESVLSYQAGFDLARLPTPIPTPTPSPTPVPTARPTPKPTARSAPHTHAPVAYEPGSVKARIAAAWPGDDAKALRVVACETGGTYSPTIVSRTGKFHGLWQFDRSTWASVGGSGVASAASVEEQTQRAWTLYQARGWRPWPECGKR